MWRLRNLDGDEEMGLYDLRWPLDTLTGFPKLLNGPQTQLHDPSPLDHYPSQPRFTCSETLFNPQPQRSTVPSLTINTWELEAFARRGAANSKPPPPQKISACGPNHATLTLSKGEPPINA
jgi:hypothetical protein